MNVLRLCLPITAAASLLAAAPLHAAEIEAVRGKEYRIDKRHGPWMIMVAHLHGRDAEGKAKALQAANALVYELRQKKIPAYVVRQEGEFERIQSFDRAGRKTEAFAVAHRDGVCVLAGNYSSYDDPAAQRTLKYIKKMQPASLSGGVYAATRGRPGPLSHAFLTLNPLLSPEEIATHARKRDPLLVKLNADNEYSLADNRGRYSLIIATFSGRSKLQVGAGADEAVPASFFEFDSKLAADNALDAAGSNAWRLCKLLRARGVEAYVWHERYRSIVTVGSFATADDPKIAQFARTFGKKTTRDPTRGIDVVVAESVQMPGAKPGDPAFILDPDPKLIEVPRLK